MTETQSSTALKIDTDKPVFMFSGQGSQKPGMGKTLFGRPLVDETMVCASDIFGFDVPRMMMEGATETLNDTRFAQAAIVSLSVALTRELHSAGITAAAILGFSLGQVSATYASGMLSLEDTFRFARIRSELMAEGAQESGGKMCALLDADKQQAQQICEESSQGQVLVIANYNCPGQIVISGDESAVLRAQAAWKAQKKRSAMLATSGAFHSPLMQGAADKLDDYLKTQIFREATVQLISNLDAKRLNASNARKHFVDHLTHPVLFQQSIESLRASGAQEFIELGFGGVLIGLVKRIDKKSERSSVESVESLDKLLSDRESKRKN